MSAFSQDAKMSALKDLISKGVSPNRAAAMAGYTTMQYKTLCSDESFYEELMVSVAGRIANVEMTAYAGAIQDPAMAFKYLTMNIETRDEWSSRSTVSIGREIEDTIAALSASIAGEVPQGIGSPALTGGGEASEASTVRTPVTGTMDTN